LYAIGKDAEVFSSVYVNTKVEKNYSNNEFEITKFNKGVEL
jgi:hypothetical protein